MDDRVLKVGDVVVYLDEHRSAHNALVTVWHGMKAGETVGDFKKKFGASGPPSVNLLFVTTKEDATDPYGQQIERRSSVGHGSIQSPKNLGNCYLWPGESVS